jgi:Uma2 family endonuclease
MPAVSYARVPEPIYYPDTDGEPMAESDHQRDYLTYLVEALKKHFQDQPQVYVSGNLLIYYEEGHPELSVAPDVFVVLDVPKQTRYTYKVWEEGKAPDVVIEITSRTTQKKDEQVKPTLYRQLGIQEYFQYDPQGEYLKPALKGRRLTSHRRYQAMTPIYGLDGSLRFTSRVLGGLELRLERGNLRLFDPKTGNYLFTYSEAVAAYRLAQQQVNQVTQQWEWERQQKESALQQKELALQQKELLANQLRALGVNPDEILKNWKPH